MNKINVKEIIRPTLALFTICIAAALALSLSNLATADKIAENEQNTLSEAMRQVLSAEEYTQVKTDIADGDTALYKASGPSGTVGYTALCTKTGYGGKIKVMVGINNDGTVKKVAIISADDETPGLGQNVKTDDFLSRFEGASNASGVDAWTGATISSTAVKGAVNEALELYNQYKE